MDTENKARIAAEKILDDILKKEGKLVFPIDPLKILQERNTLITFKDFDRLEGLLLYDKNVKSIVAINLNRPVTRQRFTAAHELGHIMLHAESLSENFFCPISGVKSSIEKEADDFASYLLLPNIELNEVISKYQDDMGNVNLDDCLYIAEYFGVSFESCVKTIRFRLNRLSLALNNKELDKEIRKYKPMTKRKELFLSTSDLDLLINSLNYSFFSLININDIVGIKFMQNLIYHENRLENINLSVEKINEIYADFRINGNESKYCKEENQNIIEALGNIEMNKYALLTDEKINIFKIIDLNKLLYKYVPYPEFAGKFRTNDNLILGGKIQPVSVSCLFEKIDELNEMITKLVANISHISLKNFISMVATIHYKLTVLHPFNDGNGRVSRAFMNWLLRLKGLCPIYIDSSNKEEYLKALNRIDSGFDNGDLQLIIVKSMLKTMALTHSSWK